MTAIAAGLGVPMFVAGASNAGQEKGVIYPERLRERAKTNVTRSAWAAVTRTGAVAVVRHWREMSKAWDSRPRPAGLRQMEIADG